MTSYPSHHGPRITRRRLIRAAGALTLAASLGLSGCSRAEDDAGAETTKDSGIAEVSNERVVAAGLGDADTLLALGITPVAVAPWGQEGDVGPKGVGPWAEEALGDAEPTQVVGTGTGFTSDIIETISETDPTKIIAVNAAVDEQARTDLEAIAPLATHSDEYPDWQVPWEQQVKDISAAVGKEKEGEEQIKKAEKAFAEFREKHPELQGQTIAVAMPYDGKLGMYTEGDSRGAFLTELGFTIPDTLPQPEEGSFYVDVAPENYHRLGDVDHLFILDYQGAADAIKDDPAFRDIDAVKNGRVHYIDEDTGNAMSMMNPLSIPWALDRIETTVS